MVKYQYFLWAFLKTPFEFKVGSAIVLDELSWFTVKFYSIDANLSLVFDLEKPESITF